jgi:cytochrome c-type biogenesis protein CcsB
MITTDPLLHLVAASAYAAAFVLLIVEVVLGKRTGRAALATGAMGLMLHVAGIAARWLVVGHGPVVTKYENLSSYALVTAVLALYLLVRKHSLRHLGLVLYPTAFILVGIGLYTGPEVQNLPPTFTGLWLVLHVCFYFLAFGTAVTGVGASVLLMTEGRARPAVAERLPDCEEMDRIAYRYAGLAFAFWGIGMLTGAIWAFSAWGRYWAWDPVETWSLITWLVFGIYLHLRRFYAWEGRKAAWLLIVSFGFAIMSLFGTTLLENSLHSVYFR